MADYIVNDTTNNSQPDLPEDGVSAEAMITGGSGLTYK